MAENSIGRGRQREAVALHADPGVSVVTGVGQATAVLLIRVGKAVLQQPGGELNRLQVAPAHRRARVGSSASRVLDQAHGLVEFETQALRLRSPAPLAPRLGAHGLA